MPKIMYFVIVQTSFLENPGWKEHCPDLRGIFPECSPSDLLEARLARAIFLAGVVSLVLPFLNSFHLLYYFNSADWRSMTKQEQGNWNKDALDLGCCSSDALISNLQSCTILKSDSEHSGFLNYLPANMVSRCSSLMQKSLWPDSLDPKCLFPSNPCQGIRQFQLIISQQLGERKAFTALQEWCLGIWLIRTKVRASFMSYGSKDLKIMAWHLAVAMNFCVVRGKEHDDESKLQAGRSPLYQADRTGCWFTFSWVFCGAHLSDFDREHSAILQGHIIRICMSGKLSCAAGDFMTLATFLHRGGLHPPRIYQKRGHPLTNPSIPTRPSKGYQRSLEHPILIVVITWYHVHHHFPDGESLWSNQPI